MSLTPEDIEFIKAHLGEWLAEASLGRPPVVYEIELRERLVRVEEELKHQRELIQQILVQIDKRFEQVDKRFEQIDKRFEQMLEYNKTRFEQIDKRFEQVESQILHLTHRIERFMTWTFATIISVGGLVVALIKLL